MTAVFDHSPGGPRLGTLWAQKLMATLGLRVMPAVAAGGIAAGHMAKPAHGVVLAVAILAASWALERPEHPLHLMPLASFLIRAGVPVAGAGLAFVTLWLAGSVPSVTSFGAAIFGAWIITLFGSFWAMRIRRTRPIRVVVIGSRGLASGLSEELAGAGIKSLEVVGWLSGSGAAAAGEHQSPPLLGSLEDVREVVEAESVDLLVHGSALPEEPDDFRQSRLEIFETVATSCLDLPVRMIEANQLYEELLGHVPLGQSNSAWFQYLLHPRYRAGVPGAKRAFDLFVAGTMLLLAAPVLLVLAAIVKLSDGGPVLYRQRRVGEGGEEFEMVKLRSMKVAAERGEGAAWSSAEDDRVTALGRHMRRLHLDELPQLWNVLRGEMTLVGPRPERRELIAELELHLAFYDRRHLVKPGIAGWAQARCGYGGSEEGTGWKLCHDLYYLKHRSVYFDLLLLLENFRVTFGTGMQFELRAPREQFILGTPRAAGE